MKISPDCFSSQDVYSDKSCFSTYISYLFPLPVGINSISSDSIHLCSCFNVTELINVRYYFLRYTMGEDIVRLRLVRREADECRECIDKPTPLSEVQSLLGVSLVDFEITWRTGKLTETHTGRKFGC